MGIFMLNLEPQEVTRYSRHYPIIGLEGQKKLKNARVLCIGAGGLGCPALQYLAATGIGTLGIIDGDVIELSNLQRQVLFTEGDIGRKKSQVIAERLCAMNQHVTVHCFTDFFSEENLNLVQEYDVILDATDNYKTRYLINRVCRDLKKPLISASIYQYEGQISIFNHFDGPCYQCLYPEPPPQHVTPNCAVGGVLGVLPGVAGTIQASEAIKLILGFAETLSGKLLCFDLLTMRFNQFAIPKQNCAEHPVVSYRSEKSTIPDNDYLVSSAELQQILQSGAHDIQLIDVRQPYEREICHIGGELIPLANLETSLDDFDKEKTIIFYCKAGGRSKQALEICLDAGFKQVYHLDGGILKWQETVDSSLIRY